MIGLFSDSHGDLGAFDRAYRLLKEMGARRFFFAGGRYSDLDDWIAWRNKQASGGNDYSDQDFLADVTGFLAGAAQVDRPPAFGLDPVAGDPEMAKVKERFVRTPERDSHQYADPVIEKKAVDMLGDALCTVVHDKNDLTRDDMLNAVVFIHGKERQPKAVQIGPRFFITPGMLTGAPEQTCALLELPEKDKVLRFSAFTLEGRMVIDHQALSLSSKSKVSVK
ncbi:MAG TPA: hypothetical protein VND93_07795 [Myxococcales bacterium]|nr:hypothetical protein [Myxococcales bacterium]